MHPAQCSGQASGVVLSEVGVQAILARDIECRVEKTGTLALGPPAGLDSWHRWYIDGVASGGIQRSRPC